MKLDTARLLAQIAAMEEDAALRRVSKPAFTPKRRTHSIKIWTLDRLPSLRVYMHGPQWRRHFNVRHVPIVDVDPSGVHPPGKMLWIFELWEDVQERICRTGDLIRPGIFAEWSESK